MTLKLIAIDMDATLLRDDKSYDMNRFNKLVREFSKTGIKVCIASGNILPKLQYYIDDTIHKDVYLAGDNGNVMAKDGKIIQETGFDKKIVSELTNLDVIKDHYEIIVSTGLSTYTTKLEEANKEGVFTYYPDLNYLETFNSLPSNEKPTKIAIYAPNSLEDNKKIKNKIKSQIKGVSVATSGYGWIDVYHEEGGKGKAVEYLQNKYDIPYEFTMAFGDSLNDEPMMEYAKYSIAMENGDDELKMLSNYIIGTNEDQAVINILEQYLEEDSLDFINKHAR